MKYNYPIIKTCNYCKKEFQIVRANDIHKTFCNTSCKTSFSNKNRIWKQSSKDKLSNKFREKFKGNTNPNFKGGGKAYHCLECGVEFRVSNNEIKSGKRKGLYCSKICAKTVRDENKMSRTQCRINKNFARALCTIIKTRNFHINSKWLKYAGFTGLEFKNRMESLFKEGMSFYNHGNDGWHIDHIIPKGSFTFETPQDIEFKKCWALSNLQPLWKNENLEKGGINIWLKNK